MVYFCKFSLKIFPFWNCLWQIWTFILIGTWQPCLSLLLLFLFFFYLFFLLSFNSLHFLCQNIFSIFNSVSISTFFSFMFYVLMLYSLFQIASLMFFFLPVFIFLPFYFFTLFLFCFYPFLSLTHSLFVTLSIFNKHTHTLSLSISLTLSHTHKHTHSLAPSGSHACSHLLNRSIKKQIWSKLKDRIIEFKNGKPKSALSNLVAIRHMWRQTA